MLTFYFSRFEEIVDEEPKSLKRSREDATETDATEGKLSKAERKRLNKKLKAESGQAVATATDSPKTASESKKGKVKPAGENKEIAGGVTTKDVKTGTGPQAKKGNMVSMRYIGKLLDGSVFDKNTKGKPVGPWLFHFGSRSQCFGIVLLPSWPGRGHQR